LIYKAKKEAALLYCKNKNLVYKQTIVRKITYMEMKDLKDMGHLKFIDRYEEKFKKYIPTK